MVAQYAEYALVGLAAVVGFALFLYVFIRAERGRRRAYDEMTPEERREEDVFRRSVFRRR